jgi:4'-phosphopantetheinyl transferase
VNSLELDGAVLYWVDEPSASSAELVSLAAARVLGVALADVTVRHTCPTCGATDHGQPHIEATAVDASQCAVSFSRAAGLAVAAARLGPAIGVDIESITAVSAHPMQEVLLHPTERREFERRAAPAGARYLASLWVCKEAVLKATGDGLRVEPSLIAVRLHGETAKVESWPDTLRLAAQPRLTLFDLSLDVVGALAVQQ